MIDVTQTYGNTYSLLSKPVWLKKNWILLPEMWYDSSLIVGKLWYSDSDPGSDYEPYNQPANYIRYPAALEADRNSEVPILDVFQTLEYNQIQAQLAEQERRKKEMFINTPEGVIEIAEADFWKGNTPSQSLATTDGAGTLPPTNDAVVRKAGIGDAITGGIEGFFKGLFGSTSAGGGMSITTMMMLMMMMGGGGMGGLNMNSLMMMMLLSQMTGIDSSGMMTGMMLSSGMKGKNIIAPAVAAAGISGIAGVLGTLIGAAGRRQQTRTRYIRGNTRYIRSYGRRNWRRY